jgi:NADP-dependent 3-hydroxy acid dehydrogenase YdfG
MCSSIRAGASSGIGKACAFAFTASGAHVCLSARRLERLQAVADQLPEGLATVATVDLTSADSCTHLVAKAVGASLQSGCQLWP